MEGQELDKRILQVTREALANAGITTYLPDEIIEPEVEKLIKGW